MKLQDSTPGTDISADKLRRVRQQILEVLNANLEDARTQHPLDATGMLLYNRPNFNGAVSIELYRAVHLLALREVLGPKIAAAVLRVSGRAMADRLGISSAGDLVDLMSEMGLGRISAQDKSGDGMVFTVEECATCAGIPNIGEPVCHFEGGLIEGALRTRYSAHVSASEVQCWGLGDKLCMWEARPTNGSDDPETDTLDAVMEIARRAAVAMENGLAVRLKNRELREAYGQLRASERMKKDLTDMIVHDMRVPVNSFMGAVETLDDLMGERLTAREAKVMDMALSSGREVARLIDDLLDISRLEEQKSTIRRTLAPATDMIDRAVRQVMILAKHKDVSLEVKIAPNMPELRVDVRRMARVLVNLLSNAIDHTPAQGSIVLEARCVPSVKRALITVSDTGEGIPEEYHQRIFDKFMQVDGGKSRRRPSTGLGLAFCKLVVEAHGGSISVKSTPGAGSAFEISLPVD